MVHLARFLEEHDKYKVLEQLNKEFSVTYTITNGCISFNTPVAIHNLGFVSLWMSTSIFDFIKFLLNQRFDSEFIGSETEKLCKHIELKCLCKIVITKLRYADYRRFLLIKHIITIDDVTFAILRLITTSYVYECKKTNAKYLLQ